MIVTIGILLVLISLIKTSAFKKGESAGVILIGPIPIIWGSSRKALIIAVTAFIVIAIMVLLLWI
ncbi:MAG: DUF131 domain-containing protein [Candidatus Nezhaarchaeota archaeon]|nr:DUF131 domain-containing protein [Candidatus Nezhaarchaeota archaeon]